MSTGKMMSQESLVELLTERGWTVVSHKEKHNQQMAELTKDRDLDPMLDMRKGISFHAISPTGYTLSLQAGTHNYAEPRRFAEEYESLEFAIWRARDGGAKDGPFIKDYRLHDGDDVVGWADFDKVMKAIEIIESWTPGNGPAQAPSREPAAWDVGD